jgi:hypothetical protein
MDCDEPHLMLNDKTWPIQWIKQPIDALVATGSLDQFSQIWLNVIEDNKIL